jgi:hypothetical protein
MNDAPATFDVIRFDDAGALVELRVSTELFRGARVPLEHIPANERAWFAKLARAAEGGDARSAALLLEAVEGALIIDDDASAMKKSRGGDSPA